ncbi:bifunctional 4-hydroxy-2-oxoglutarate aldolase/2-dehydro-3-deoxy-phosphogluconate aldolase [Thermoanaerobacterium thermosaccharolyticum]|uniref:bifunctional 4-hydroxy-2-oxoglutarate aldolase/2-dehydro-3-deoxy-phosphogluconate aldolase n=2 Tax=Thermoanaerobacterium thermosaccharolyticum TaxID=1517 RepID=UPI003D2B8178
MSFMSFKEIKEKTKKGIFSVIRCKDYELGMKMAEKVIECGINIIEITYTVEGAGKLIKELKKKYPDKIVGAGTVLELSQAEEAVGSGADFVVTPCIVEEVASYCKKNDVFFSMAAATTTEMFKAYKMGSEVIKLFPGEFVNSKIIKSLKGPFPFLEFMPTGGVNDENINEWFENGAYAVGVGGYLTKGINFDNLDLLEERAKRLVNAVK